jgi:tetratricopeptide (TPR) repeat protein
MRHEASAYTEIETEIINSLINGRNAFNAKIAKGYFDQALQKSRSIFKSSQIAHSLYLESLAELAGIEYEIRKRTDLWKQLFEKIIEFINLFPSNENLLLNCADNLISYIKEPFISKDPQSQKRALIILKSKIDGLITMNGLEVSGHVLVTKATVLRHLAFYESTPDAQKQIFDKAVRCVVKSLSLKQTWFGFLELGNCYWGMSNFEKKLESYSDKLRLSEEAFKNSQDILHTVQNTLALCDFFKETYQIAPFLSAFKKYELIEKSKRRYYQHSVHLAETTIRMIYANYPADLLSECISKSDRLLSEAIAAGYQDARMITDLAFIKAANGEISVGTTIVKTLRSGTEAFDWNTIMADIRTIKDSEDLFSKGFVLGIDDASIWNKLGTFSIKFLDDLELGIKMYDVALHFNPKNSIALTNMARALLKTDLTEEGLKNVEYYISRASSASTFRFQWWRQVKAEFESAKAKFYHDKNITPTNKRSFDLSKIADLYKLYLGLKTSDDVQRRGYDFEKLIATYFKISLGNARGSHRIISATTEQIDAAFFFEKDCYRVEVKWTKVPVDDDDIKNFSFKLDTIGVKGLIISINGFTASAIARAKSLKEKKQILLMDGDEIEATLKGSPTFDEAIREKQLHFLYEDNPYHKIKSTEQKV